VLANGNGQGTSTHVCKDILEEDKTKYIGILLKRIARALEIKIGILDG
jgi:hypothetical protein